jgi:hypothetical protein
MEVSVFQHPGSECILKSTFPGKAGCGPFGFYTPAGYLRRMRLTNLVFGEAIAGLRMG